MRTPQFANESQLLCSHVSCIYIVESSPRNASFLLLYCTYLKRLFFHFVQKKSDLVHTNIFVSRGNQRYKQRYKRTHIIMRGALAPSTRTTATCYSPTLKKNNVRTKHGSIGPLRSSARKCAVVRVVRSEADNQPESSSSSRSEKEQRERGRERTSGNFEKSGGRNHERGGNQEERADGYADF